MICLFDYLLENRTSSICQKYSSNYLIGLIKQNLPLFTLSIVLNIEKGDFKFRFNEQGQDGSINKLACDNINFFSKCNKNTF